MCDLKSIIIIDSDFLEFLEYSTRENSLNPNILFKIKGQDIATSSIHYQKLKLVFQMH